MFPQVCVYVCVRARVRACMRKCVRVKNLPLPTYKLIICRKKHLVTSYLRGWCLNTDAHPMLSLAACAVNCNMCATKGSGKCDPAGCKTGYQLKADFTACEGKLR